MELLLGRWGWTCYWDALFLFFLVLWMFPSQGLAGPAGPTGPPGTRGDPGESVSADEAQTWTHEGSSDPTLTPHIDTRPRDHKVPVQFRENRMLTHTCLTWFSIVCVCVCWFRKCSCLWFIIGKLIPVHLVTDRCSVILQSLIVFIARLFQRWWMAIYETTDSRYLQAPSPFSLMTHFFF